MRVIGIVVCALAVTIVACDDGDGVPPATATRTTVATATAAPTPVPVTTILFTGDIIPARCSYAAIEARGGDYRLPFEPLHDVLSSADITVATLDSTASDVAVPIGCTPTFNLASPKAAVDGMAYAGYDVISHAANHIKDCGNAACGDDAMLQTITNLRGAGIKPVGSGPNLVEARAPAVIERNGVYFAFLAYDDIAAYYNAGADTAGSAPLDAAMVREDITNARKVANVVVVMPHWGVEYTADPSARQREIARVAAEAGAEVVIGNHPHWVQAHETIGDTFVAYALGNFVFDQDWSIETQQGAMLEVTFTGSRMTGYRYIPVRIHDEFQPRLAEGIEAAQILERIETASAALVP